MGKEINSNNVPMVAVDVIDFLEAPPSGAFFDWTTSMPVRYNERGNSHTFSIAGGIHSWHRILKEDERKRS
ncbi:hypothetical protein [Paenibacillus sp. GCM10027626]|uniref:hypothetical protein n=1 Tax=Paenibacillus sp. GCM10027626 TaxID=3273411 RepID=UPI00362DD8C8